LKRALSRALPALALLGWAGPALAHHVVGGESPRTVSQALLSGVAHPVLGLDHLLFLVLVGLLLPTLAAPSRYLVPAALLAGTVLGCVLHGAGGLPFAGVAVVSTIGIGLAVLVARRRLTILGSSIFLAVAGVFHGHAYGEAIDGAGPAPFAAYLFGLCAIQYIVIFAIATARRALASVVASRGAVVQERSLS
jgi:urease accessory protein